MAAQQGTKLDQSLDQIMKDAGSTRGGRAGRRRGGARRAHKAVAAPVGGIAKAPRGPKAPAKTAAPVVRRDSKIVVSNLPKDVDHNQIKEYFAKSVAPVKRVDVVYGPKGESRGIATIIFSTADGATKAVSNLSGLLIDNRPLKIEVVVDASQAQSIVPVAKSLSERVVQPKAQPKSAANTKKTDAAAAGSGTRGKAAKKGRGGRAKNARPAKKTAEELDSEMADYWGAAEAAPAEAAPVAANGGDAPMEDEML